MLKKLGLGLSLLLLTACTSVPHQLDIQVPSTTAAVQPAYAGVTVDLSSRDVRDAFYLIAIHQAGDAATLVNNKTPLAQLAESGLANGWQKQGLTITKDGQIKAQLEIQIARIDVQQDSFEYEAESSLVVSITVNNGIKTLTKQFQSKSMMTGPLSPNIEQLETKFTEQLTTVLNDIYQDKQIINYLTH